ncbi:MAG: peptide chain release factor N(5)-glutamine methyltransferase [Bacteroidales bacterium]|nr:peptide chain release factor N(5)-glutamine methyltransferase [Bacteroidales bacterium]
MRIPSNKVKDIVRFAQEELAEMYPKEEISSLIYALLERFGGIGFLKALSEPELTVSESELLKIHFAIKDLKQYCPLQYILGSCDFVNVNILLSQKVLIPRPETEEMVGLIIEENKLKRGLTIADFGCGSGCIAVALAKNLFDSKVFAFDKSDEALEQTKANAAHNDVEVEVIKVDMTDALELNEQFDIIVSNPPYIRECEKTQMKANVLDYEPHMALFVPNENPLVFYQHIASIAQSSLKTGGKLYLEINEALGEETEVIFKNLGCKTEIRKDFRDKYRMLFATKEF